MTTAAITDQLHKLAHTIATAPTFEAVEAAAIAAGLGVTLESFPGVGDGDPFVCLTFHTDDAIVEWRVGKKDTFPNSTAAFKAALPWLRRRVQT
jgi:hypothetical protein